MTRKMSERMLKRRPSLSEGADAAALVGSSVMPPPPMKSIHPTKGSITLADSLLSKDEAHRHKWLLTTPLKYF